MLDETYLERLTGFNARQRDQLVGYYRKINETSRIEVHRRQSAVYTEWRNNERQSGYSNDKKAETSYGAFLVVLFAMQKEDRKIIKPAKDADRQENIRIKRMKEGPKKRDAKVKDYIDKKLFTEIERKRNEGMSWRAIARLSETMWEFPVCSIYLHECYDKIANARKFQKLGKDSGVDVKEIKKQEQ
jgi:hypothetical protein